jgi:hypothetical protein
VILAAIHMAHFRYLVSENTECSVVFQDVDADIAGYKLALWQFLSEGWKTAER